MNMPKDPYMLLSFVNTQLRDNFSTLSDLAASYGVSPDEITEKLGDAGYIYDSNKNAFIGMQQ